MRLSLRFVVPLGIALAAIAYAVVPLVDRLTLKWFVQDLERRSELVANTMQEPFADLLREHSRVKLVRSNAAAAWRCWPMTASARPSS